MVRSQLESGAAYGRQVSISTEVVVTVAVVVVGTVSVVSIVDMTVVPATMVMSDEIVTFTVDIT